MEMTVILDSRRLKKHGGKYCKCNGAQRCAQDRPHAEGHEAEHKSPKSAEGEEVEDGAGGG